MNGHHGDSSGAARRAPEPSRGIVGHLAAPASAYRTARYASPEGLRSPRRCRQRKVYEPTALVPNLANISKLRIVGHFLQCRSTIRQE
jgi:hypothetical protein